MTTDSLDRGTVLVCSQCNAEVAIVRKGELPAGWVVLRNTGWVQVSCPVCDAKEQARYEVLMRGGVNEQASRHS